MQWENNFGTTTFEGFMKRMFEVLPDKDWLWFDCKFFNRKVIYTLSGGKVAEIVLSTLGTHGQYEALTVSIIHKDNGLISSERFKFSDYLMNGFKSMPTEKYPKVIEHCGIDWYMNGPTPKAIKSLITKIAEYISIYK